MSRSQRIYDALSHALTPATLIIEDESSQHHVPVGSETHFKLIIVATSFEALNRVERHRKVTSLLKDEFVTGLHALSLLLYTPEEWRQRNTDLPSTPKCHNGKHRDELK